eukprot:m.280832 g.280832  ORF g.280832 m.280832 type:complete len:216 (-) comp54919_c1_seq28:207-854(-)
MSEEEYASSEEHVEEEVDEEEEEDDEEEDDAPAPTKAAAKAKAAPAKRSGKKAKDPNKPKGATSAYMFYMKEQRPKVLQTNPGMAMTAVASHVAGMWRELSDQAKAPYEKLAAADKIRAQADKANYVPTNAGNGKRAKKDPNEPKRPLSAYFVFSNAKRGDLKAADPTLSIGDTAKKLAALWATMSDAQKKPYTDKAAVLKAEYTVKMESYKKSA